MGIRKNKDMSEIPTEILEDMQRQDATKKRTVKKYMNDEQLSEYKKNKWIGRI